MKNLMLLATMMMTASMLFAQVIHIPADYPTIQQGVEAASNGDTVLVHPGTYYENVSIVRKRLTLASLFLTTQDTSYISQTVIHGNQESAVLGIGSNTSPVKMVSIFGFTIMNGNRGVGCSNANAIIQNVIIYNNYYEGIRLHETNIWLEDVIVRNNGVGIYSSNSSPVFKSVTVKENNNGGIDLHNSIPVFDSLQRCNIYHNSGLFYGNDIRCYPASGDPIQVYLDTFSVVNPQAYHTHPLESFTFQINYGMIEQVEADLFVSPFGDDANSGLTPDEPLKRIKIANSKIISDSTDRRTIHLLAGTYSPSGNGEAFPVRVIDHVNLSGVSRDQVVLDAEGGPSQYWSSVLSPSSNVRISGMTITGGNCGIAFWGSNNVIMEQLIITGNSGGFILGGAGVWISYCTDLLFNDVIISDNIIQTEDYALGGGIYCENSNPVFHNVTISNNTVTSLDNYYSNGGGIYCWNSSPIFGNCFFTNNSAYAGGAVYCGDGSNPVFRNVVFSGNNWGWGGEGSVLFLSNYGNPCFPSLINCTMTGNYSGYGIYGYYYTIIGYDYPCTSNVTVINSISWYNGNEYGWCDFDLPYSTVSYSNVGDEYGYVTPGEGNINMEPLFLGTGEHPYQLSPGSPCIDAGTPDISGLNLPVWDLMGNYRLWDGNMDGDTVVDMGAYEFGSFGVGIEQVKVQSPMFKVEVFPNPFSEIVRIEFEIENPSTVSIQVYNAVGERVAILSDGILSEGRHQIIWNAAKLPAGSYFCRVQAGKEVTTQKILKY